MTERTLGGLLLVGAAIALAWLWARGYLSGVLQTTAEAFAAPPKLRPAQFAAPVGRRVALIPF